LKEHTQNTSKIFLLITYSDVFSGARPTLADLRARLAALPKIPVVKVCSILNALLRKDINSVEPISLLAHRALVGAYLPPEAARRILQLEHGNPPRVAFHRQQVLFVMKEALQYASDDSTLDMTNSMLGELFLIANDHMHFDLNAECPDTLDRFVIIASTFLQLREGIAVNARHKMLRSYQMIKAATESSRIRPAFDLLELFERATGLELADFYALIVAAISRFATFDASRYLADPSSYSLDESWFGSSKATSDAIQRFFKLTAATPDEFADHLSRNTGPNDFTAFRNKPLLRASSKLDLIDFWMLAEKFDSGPFWAALSAVAPEQKVAFHSFRGKLFEKYIGDLLKNSADGKHNRVHISPCFRGTCEEFADVVIVCGQDMVLLEAKGATFAATSKYQGDYHILRQALESKLVESQDRPQAVKQLTRNIGRAFSEARQEVEGLDLRYVRSVFPVIVTRDDLGGVPGVNAFLDLRFRDLLDRKAIRTSIAPLTCMSSEIIESISAYLKDTSLVQILEAQIRANRRGETRYQTMPFFTVPNAVLVRKGERPIPNQLVNFDSLVDLCVDRLGLRPDTSSSP
jgi:hypothetical protein